MPHTQLNNSEPIVRIDNEIFLGERTRIEASNHLHVVQAECLSHDLVEVDTGEPEMLTLRSVHEDGTVQTISLSPRGVAKLAKLLDGYLIIPASKIADNDHP